MWCRALFVGVTIVAATLVLSESDVTVGSDSHSRCSLGSACLLAVGLRAPQTLKAKRVLTVQIVSIALVGALLVWTR